jgi:hypothetical protein
LVPADCEVIMDSSLIEGLIVGNFLRVVEASGQLGKVLQVFLMLLICEVADLFISQMFHQKRNEPRISQCEQENFHSFCGSSQHGRRKV